MLLASSNTVSSMITVLLEYEVDFPVILRLPETTRSPAIVPPLNGNALLALRKAAVMFVFAVVRAPPRLATLEFT